MSEHTVGFDRNCSSRNLGCFFFFFLDQIVNYPDFELIIFYKMSLYCPYYSHSQKQTGFSIKQKNKNARSLQGTFRHNLIKHAYIQGADTIQFLRHVTIVFAQAL